MAEAKFSVVIPTAGTGSRFGGKKQFREHRGKSLLEWTLEPFLKLEARLERIVLVFSREDHDAHAETWRAYHSLIDCCIGGDTRQASVFNGLSRLKERQDPAGIWLVHDAARPLVKANEIEKLLDTISKHDCGALLAMPARDTIKRADAERRVEKTEDRAVIWQAQTPQGGPARVLHDAYQVAVGEGLQTTDEASIMETQGIEVRLVEGSSSNFKVTTPEDWNIFCALIDSALT